MYDSAKYLIHADIRASGVVERSDVVGAIFGQTEGLLGDELDLRDLQESSKVGRIDVEIDSEGGRSFGTVTIATGLDKVQTAVLAAGLETIERVGPCRAEFEVAELEDARKAKRRAVVERATDLLVELDESSLSSRELLEEVRQNVRVAHITEYEGYPAGPRVTDSDAIIVVEGRADVLTLLRYGIKNAVAVEGTDVPDEIADLTHERTVTAFLDGDRGGDLILKELAQVGSVDYATFAPAERSVEDLSRTEVLSALRKKAQYAEVADADSPHEQLVGEGETTTSSPATAGDSEDDDAGDESGAGETIADDADSDAEVAHASTEGHPTETATAHSSGDAAAAVAAATTSETEAAAAGTGDDASAAATPEEQSDDRGPPETLAGHVEAVIDAETGRVRLLDSTFGILAETAAEEAFDAIEAADPVPRAVVLDGTLTQRVLDVAAQRGVANVVARERGEFVKQPTAVRVRTATEL